MECGVANRGVGENTNWRARSVEISGRGGSVRIEEVWRGDSRQKITKKFSAGTPPQL